MQPQPDRAAPSLDSQTLASLPIATPAVDVRKLGAIALAHLRGVIAIDSASDERSDSIPSTPGQAVLANHVGAFFTSCGASVEIDDYANIIATLPGSGRGVDQAPIAFMVHLDTARGTNATDALTLVRGWDGTSLSFTENPDLAVSVANYPSLSLFLGHDVVHGPGDAPIGLDDKLGLTHLMSLASLLSGGEPVDHPPLLFIGRPDEEIGRMAAIEGLALTLAERGVEFGYTVDGILPFEVNVENFNAASAKITFAPRAITLKGSLGLALSLGGVNTHGCTAKAEGHRPATRFATELLARLKDANLPVEVAGFVSDTLRDCDGVLTLAVPNDDVAAQVATLAEAVIAPHRPRGASLLVAAVPLAEMVTDADTDLDLAAAGATADALAFIGAFLNSDGVHPIAAEDSEGREGYSQPYRLHPVDGGAVVDIRLRDFDTDGLIARQRHVEVVAAACEIQPVEVLLADQYVNMAPRLADRSDLVTWPMEAAHALGERAEKLPIRGGTGVDPFLDAGVPVANLGTGYFAPESEKELTSVQSMAGHATWLYSLVQRIAHARWQLLETGIS